MTNILQHVTDQYLMSVVIAFCLGFVMTFAARFLAFPAIAYVARHIAW